LNILKALKEEHEAKLKEIDVYRKNDAENLTKLQNESEAFKKKVNDWTGLKRTIIFNNYFKFLL